MTRVDANRNEKAEPYRAPGLLPAVPLVQQVGRHIDRRVCNVAQRHDEPQHFDRLDDLQVGEHRRDADPGEQAGPAEEPVAQKKQRKLDDPEQDAPPQIEQIHFPPLPCLYL